MLEAEIQSVREAIDGMAQTQGEGVFLLSPETGRVLTFADLKKQSLAIASRLQKAGLQRGDKVAFLMDNGLFTVQLFLGTMYAGLVSVPLNVRAGVAQIAYMLEHCDARVIFVEHQYQALAELAMAGVSRPAQMNIADLDGFADATATPFDDPPWAAPEGKDPALLMYSSGTVSRPKAAIHSHRTLLAHGRNSILSHELARADRSLLVLPLYHINAECVTLMPTLLSGGSVVVPHHFNVSQFWDWLDDYRCTWSAVVPTIIAQLLDWQDPRAESRRSAHKRIRFLRSSSAPLSPSLHREFLNKFELLLIQAMGSTETGNVFSNPLPPGENKIGSPGLAWGFETRIIDDNGADLPAGEPGEVLLRGPAIMQGYYKDADGTGAVLDPEGWLHTGDLAYRDRDGYFFVVGRSKELIIKGGVNIAPRQIDEVLESHPAVLEAAVVGVPDRYVGEDVVAFAVLRAGMGADQREMLAFCEDRLGPFKTPTRIHFVADLPKGPSGKVQRLHLLDRAINLAAIAVPNNNRDAGESTEQRSFSIIEHTVAESWAELLGQPQVDPDSNFFALGGHSLMALRCLSKLREKLPVALSLSDFFENPTVALQAALVSRRLNEPNGTVGSPLTRRSSAGDDQISQRAIEETARFRPIARRARNSPYLLSPGQRRLWFFRELAPELPLYNESEAVRLLGELDVGAMQEALDAVIARHEVLRTTFHRTADGPMASVHESWPLRIRQINLSGLAAAQREAEVERLLIDEPRRLYDLENEPGIRVTLLRLGAREHVFILMMHHIICDRWSTGIVSRELTALYQALVCGKTPALPPLPIQNGDYVVWQLQRVEADFADDFAYWEENLRGAPDLLELPTDRPRPRVQSYRGARRRFRLSASLAEGLRNRSRQEKASLFTIFTAVLNVLLYRYTGSEDVVVGIPVADRDRHEAQSLIGFLIDTHALRTRLSGGMPFRELLARVQTGLVGLYCHREIPFDQVVSRLQPVRNLSNAPLFQVMINCRDREMQLMFVGLPGIEVESLLSHNNTSKFDFTLYPFDSGKDILLEIEYNRDLFDEQRILRMIGHYQTLLEAIVADPEQCVAKLPLLTAGERQQLLVEWNQTAVAYPKERCVHELFEEQAERAPEAVAVVFEDEQLTYRQLNERANQLARHLQGLGVGPDTLVAICVERSLEMVVGLLGILKAGGAYVPLDPSYPGARLAFMLRDSGTLLLLTHQRLRDQLEVGSPNTGILCLDTDWETIGRSPTENPKCDAGPENLAYVIYTSGSTGEPKGVEIAHGALLNLIFWHRRTYQVSPVDRATQLAGVGFDASVWELWPYLSAGASIHIPDEDTRLLPEKLRDWLVEREITLSFVPTPLAEALVALPWPSNIALRTLLTGGDRLTCHASASLPFPLVNHYGPTEDTVVSTCAVVDVESQDGKSPPIGKPIANAQTYVVDGRLQPVPIGVPGELLVGGAGLARGYLRRPELTAEKFIANPFGRDPGARLYKTGDLVRYSSTGAIEFLGRNDDQLKIRGFRIELGEIESALAGHPAVQAAVVLAREDVPGEKRLTAYAATRSLAPSVTDLRDYLKRRLPDYMIPSGFVFLEQFPLTPHGKIDRAALPAPDSGNTLRDEAGAPPVTGVENTVAGIVASLLGVDQVDAQANFFALGGHSLLGAQLIARIRAAFGIILPLRRVFDAATVAELSADIEEILVAEVEAMSEDEVRPSYDPAPLTDAKDVWH